MVTIKVGDVYELKGSEIAKVTNIQTENLVTWVYYKIQPEEKCNRHLMSFERYNSTEFFESKIIRKLTKEELAVMAV